MSVITGVPVRIRPFSGYTDSALPMGTWSAVESVLGDASGGVREIDFQFQFTTGPRSTLLFSLEQFFITDTANVDTQALLATLNMARVDPTTLPTPRWSLPLVGSPAVIDGAHMALQDRGSLFLGSPSDSNVTAILLIQLANVLNETLHAGVEGYVWGPRSVLALGGPSKPVQGLYSR